MYNRWADIFGDANQTLGLAPRGSRHAHRYLHRWKLHSCVHLRRQWKSPQLWELRAPAEAHDAVNHVVIAHLPSPRLQPSTVDSVNTPPPPPPPPPPPGPPPPPPNRPTSPPPH